jgi:hypothetical protein
MKYLGHISDPDEAFLSLDKNLLQYECTAGLEVLTAVIVDSKMTPCSP